jgi:uncharacterized protein YjbJ (UPF0337 family)
MGLFDIIKEKVGELVSGAGDKVTELTGAELPGGEVVDQATQAAGNVGETAQGVADTATGAVQDVTGSASEAATNALGDINPLK